MSEPYKKLLFVTFSVNSLLTNTCYRSRYNLMPSEMSDTCFSVEKVKGFVIKLIQKKLQVLYVIVFTCSEIDIHDSF